MTSSVLETLRRLHACHLKMVESAGNLDWDRTTALWGEAKPLYIELRNSRLSSLAGNERDEGIRLVKAILSTHQEIESRARPWMEQVKPLLDCFSENSGSSSPRPEN